MKRAIALDEQNVMSETPMTKGAHKLYHKKVDKGGKGSGLQEAAVHSSQIEN